MSEITVYSVERCYDYEGCSLERVFGSRAEAEAYAEKEKSEGTSAEMTISEWAVALPSESLGQEEP